MASDSLYWPRIGCNSDPCPGKVSVMVWWGRGQDNCNETAWADPANQRPEPSVAAQSEAPCDELMVWGDGAGIISDQADTPGDRGQDGWQTAL